MATNKARPRLVPARPSVPDASSSYMPRIPWLYIVLGAASFTVIAGGYWWKQQRKAAELREAIVRVHEVELAEASDAYGKLRGKLESLIVNASGTEPTTLVDPRLHLPGLRSGNGLYLRLPLSAANKRDEIANAAKVVTPDRIATCLGLAPASARGLYEKGEFLTPAHLKELKRETDVLKLRVEDEMLSRRIRADLPSVLGMTRSDWFMLVLQEGDNRRDAPVRVFLWGLRDDDQSELLLRARVQSQGVLMTTRILSKTTTEAPPIDPDRAHTGAANDCSIADQLRKMSEVSEKN